MPPVRHRMMPCPKERATKEPQRPRNRKRKRSGQPNANKEQKNLEQEKETEKDNPDKENVMSVWESREAFSKGVLLHPSTAAWVASDLRQF